MVIYWPCDPCSENPKDIDVKRTVRFTRTKPVEITSIGDFYFKRTKYKYLTAIILSFEIMDWDMWDSIFLWSPNNILIACVSEKNCKETWIWLCLVNCRVCLSAWISCLCSHITRGTLWDADSSYMWELLWNLYPEYCDFCTGFSKDYLALRSFTE